MSFNSEPRQLTNEERAAQNANAFIGSLQMAVQDIANGTAEDTIADRVSHYQLNAFREAAASGDAKLIAEAKEAIEAADKALAEVK